MVLKFGAKGPARGPARMEDVTGLIAKKNYPRAIEVIREQLKGNNREPRLRLQLADVLVMAGKGPQAIAILDPLADEFARDGFAAKAISVLKKIQKIDPNRRDVDKRLASLIEEKQRIATISLPSPASALPEIGMEEIGMELPMAPLAVPAAGPAPPPPPEAEPEPEAEPPALEVTLEAEPETEQPPAPAPPAAASEELPAFDFGGSTEPASAEDALPLDLPAPVEDRDLILEEDDFVEPEAEPGEEPALAEAEPPAEDVMSDNAFADELMSVIDEAFSGLAAGDGGPALEGLPQDTGAGNQIVVSPLFKHLSVDEMVAVIQGLKLLSFERGKVIIRQGEKGDSLYMLTAGSVRAFAKKDGKQVKLGDLEEGAFFGEVSILTGKPRSATIVALSDCELLELNRATLDEIVKKHPHVWDVMQEFGQQRTARSS